MEFEKVLSYIIHGIKGEMKQIILQRDEIKKQIIFFEKCLDRPNSYNSHLENIEKIKQFRKNLDSENFDEKINKCKAKIELIEWYRSPKIFEKIPYCDTREVRVRHDYWECHGNKCRNDNYDIADGDSDDYIGYDRGTWEYKLEYGVLVLSYCLSCGVDYLEFPSCSICDKNIDFKDDGNNERRINIRINDGDSDDTFESVICHMCMTLMELKQ